MEDYIEKVIGELSVEITDKSKDTQVIWALLEKRTERKTRGLETIRERLLVLRDHYETETLRKKGLNPEAAELAEAVLEAPRHLTETMLRDPVFAAWIKEVTEKEMDPSKFIRAIATRIQSENSFLIDDPVRILLQQNIKIKSDRVWTIPEYIEEMVERTKEKQVVNLDRNEEKLKADLGNLTQEEEELANKALQDRETALAIKALHINNRLPRILIKLMEAARVAGRRVQISAPGAEISMSA